MGRALLSFCRPVFGRPSAAAPHTALARCRSAHAGHLRAPDPSGARLPPCPSRARGGPRAAPPPRGGRAPRTLCRPPHGGPALCQARDAGTCGAPASWSSASQHRRAGTAPPSSACPSPPPARLPPCPVAWAGTCHGPRPSARGSARP